MKLEHIEGNALEWAQKDGYCMIHVCNNRGGYGGGRTALATQIKSVSPSAYQAYLDHYSNGGTCSIDSTCSFINMIAQNGYGSRHKGVQYLNYDWLDSCLAYIFSFSNGLKAHMKIHTIVVPYKMGADRAGGDWDEILKMVKMRLELAFNILVVEWDGK